MIARVWKSLFVIKSTIFSARIYKAEEMFSAMLEDVRLNKGFLSRQPGITSRAIHVGSVLIKATWTLLRTLRLFIYYRQSTNASRSCVTICKLSKGPDHSLFPQFGASRLIVTSLDSVSKQHVSL
jgi:hypothetical protein